MPMKIKRAFIVFGLLTLVYLGLLVWADSRSNIFEYVPTLLQSLPVLALFSFASYLLRYLRWQWLFTRAGFVIPITVGLLGYLAGFAFTATPGKVGELLRIRYLEPLGVPPCRVVAGFVYERSFDLLVVLVLAALAAAHFGIFPFVALFVSVVILVVVLVAMNPSWLLGVIIFFRRRGFNRLSKLARTLRNGIAGAVDWVDPLSVSVSFLLGLAAWGLTTGAFVWLLGQLNISIPFSIAIAVYPLAMLAGAASMLPGGLASTEAAVIALLVTQKVPFDQAMVAAVGIRLGTLWFSILLGLSSSLALEMRAAMWDSQRCPAKRVQ